MRPVALLAIAAMTSPAAANAGAPRYLVVATTPPVYRATYELLDGAGRIVRVLARGQRTQSWAAAWSPDRSRIAWIGNGGIFVERADGAERRRVVPAAAGCRKVCAAQSLAWSPDGRSLLVGGVGTETNRLVIVSIATGRPRDLVTPRPYTEYTVVGWSRGGVAYTRASGDPGTRSCCRLDLVVSQPDGGAARTLFSFRDPIHDFPFAAWSPDGRSLAFTDDGRDPRDPRFAVVDVKTGRVRAIRGVEPFDQVPAWSPDSRRLAVAQSNGPTVTLSAATGGDVRSLGTSGTRALWTRRGDLLVVQGPLSNAAAIARSGHAPARRVFHMPGKQQILSIDPA